MKLFTIIECFIVLSIILLVGLTPNVLFIINIILCAKICLKSKLSLFSIKELLLIYVMISICIQYNTGESYGILEYSGNSILYYYEMNIMLIIYNIILYIYISTSKVLQYEKVKITSEQFTSNKACLLFSILAIVFTIIAFPRIGFIDNAAQRFHSLLPGNAWNHVAVICLLLVLPRIKNNIYVKISYLFCISWFLINKERVDMIGIMFCLLVYLFSNKIIKINLKNKIKYYLKFGAIALLLVTSMVFIGLKRANINNINMNTIMKNILVQPTAADVGYTYNSSIRYVNDFGLLKGQTYSHYVVELIPFILDTKSAAYYLIYNYRSPGGIFLLSEPYMNFGIIGIVLFEIIELKLISTIIKSKNNYSFYLYLFILATAFRTSWYGIEYIEKGVVYLLPFLFILLININKGEKKYERNKSINYSTNI